MGAVKSQLAPYPSDYRIEKCIRLFKIPDEKLEDLWSIFVKYDRDKKGIIYMQDFLANVLKCEKSPLTTSLPGLIETKHEGAMDFGEFVEIVCTICNFERMELIRYAFFILDPYRTGRIQREELKHFVQAIWYHDAPITLQEAIQYLDDHDEGGTGIFTMRQVESIIAKYPTIMFPVFRLQIQMIENTLGQYWWDTHKAKLKEDQEEEKRREWEAAERKRKNAEIDDEAATMRMVKARMGIRYYLMPWMIANEKRKLLRIAAIEKELETKVKIK